MRRKSVKRKGARKSSIKKIRKSGRTLKNRRSRSSLNKGKRRGARAEKRRRGGTRLRKKSGSFHSGYNRGYREGHSKGFEDAHQESYMKDTGAAVARTNQAVTILSPSEADIASIAGSRIGILYICTGRYTVFWENFYRSAEEHFLPGYPKKYYVFTDAETIAAEESDHVQKIYQDNLGWPGNTLMRYTIFRNAVQQLEQECDFVYFFNANMQFMDTVREEILPIHEGLVAVQHPGFYDKPRHELDFEKNPRSLAYVPDNAGSYYFMGGLNGGRTEHYINLIRVLDENIRADLNMGIQAVWHDESHLNKYMSDKNPKVMTPSYGYMEGSELPFPVKILIRDKKYFGGHSFLRNL